MQLTVENLRSQLAGKNIETPWVSIISHKESVSLWNDAWLDRDNGDTWAQSTLRFIKALLKERGFTFILDPRVKKDLPPLARWNWRGHYKGLECLIRRSGRGIQIDFLPTYGEFTQPHGPEFESNKFGRMSYLDKKRVLLFRQKLAEEFSRLGYEIKDSTPPKNAFARIDQQRKYQHWSSKDEDLGSYNTKDQNGQTIKNGDVKYFYDYKGKLQRGTCYHNINNMWWVVLHEESIKNVACFDLFSDPKSGKDRDKLSRLKKIQAAFVSAEKYEKAIFLRDQIRKLSEEQET